MKKIIDFFGEGFSLLSDVTRPSLNVSAEEVASVLDDIAKSPEHSPPPPTDMNFVRQVVDF